MRKAFHVKKILIPTDFSETADLAMDHAVFMSRLIKAEILLIHVVETYSFASSLTHVFSKTQESYDEKLEGSSDQRLREMAEKIHRTTGMPVNVFTAKGKISKMIAKVAEEKQADLIIMGTHGTGNGEGAAGSNAYKVATQSDCPVIIIHGQAKKTGYHNIVLPIDNTAASRQKVPMAIEIAKYYRSKIHIVGLNTLSNPEFQKRFELKVMQVRDFVEEHEVPFTMKVIKGNHLQTPLLDYAQQVNADLMIVLTDQEGASVSHLINNASVPIMTVRPDEGDPDKISLGY